MQANATISASGAISERSLPSTFGWIGSFAVFGVGFLAISPGLAATAGIACAASMAIAAMTSTGSWQTGELSARRATVRWLSSGLMAALLWMAILGANAAFAGSGILASCLAATALFSGLVVVEAIVSAVTTALFAKTTGADPAIGIAVQVADKYAGLAGEIA